MNDPTLTNNKPDAEIEDFWLGLKQSMHNFYTSTNQLLPRNIVEWSNRLNDYQQLEMYEEIEKCIRDYISLYAIDVIRSNDINQQYFKLLDTNIKRWCKISNKFNFLNISHDPTTSYYNIMYLIIDLYKSVLTDEIGRKLFEDIELLLLNKDFTNIIKYAVANNKPGILKKISKYYNLHDLISDIYGIILPSKNITPVKIIALITG